MSKKNAVKVVETKTETKEVKDDEQNNNIVEKAMGIAKRNRNAILAGCGMAIATAAGFVLGHFVFAPKPSGYLDSVVSATLDSGHDDDDDDDDEDDD